MMLNENIKAIRKQRGLSQEELAIRLHVVRQTVSKWHGAGRKCCFHQRPAGNRYRSLQGRTENNIT